MSDTVQIALIIAGVVVIAFLLLRKRLTRFFFQADREGFKAELEADGSGDAGASNSGPGSRPGGVKITGVTMKGKRHKIGVDRDDVEIEDVGISGKDHEIAVGRNEGSDEEK